MRHDVCILDLPGSASSASIVVSAAAGLFAVALLLDAAVVEDVK